MEFFLIDYRKLPINSLGSNTGATIKEVVESSRIIPPRFCKEINMYLKSIKLEERLLDFPQPTSSKRARLEDSLRSSALTGNVAKPELNNKCSNLVWDIPLTFQTMTEEGHLKVNAEVSNKNSVLHRLMSIFKHGDVEFFLHVKSERIDNDCNNGGTNPLVPSSSSDPSPNHQIKKEFTLTKRLEQKPSSRGALYTLEAVFSVNGNLEETLVAKNGISMSFDGRWALSFKIVAPFLCGNDTSAAFSCLQMNRNILERRVATDFKLISKDGEEFPCHKCFIQAKSAVISQMLQPKPNTQELPLDHLDMPDMSAAGVKALLAFIYLHDESAVENSEMALELYRAANKYQIEDLLHDMTDLFNRRKQPWFTTDVAVKLFTYTRNFPNAVELKFKAFEILRRSTEAELDRSEDFTSLMNYNGDAAKDLCIMALKWK